MSLETLAASVTYPGNGSDSDPYPIPFKFLAAEHLKVVVRDAGGHEQPLAFGQFTVTQLESGLGQLVTATGWDASHQVVITRATPTAQPMVLQDGAMIPAKTLERAFDRLAMIVQETRGYNAAQETGPHAATHAQDAGDPVTVSQSQVIGLAEALAAKALDATVSAHLAHTGNPHAVTKAQVGLGSVNNTADLDKPVSTATQSALNAKADKLLATSARTGASETLALTDAGKLVTMERSSANTLTVPPHSSVALPVGSQILVKQLGAGATTIVAGAGVTIHSRDNLMALAGRYAVAVLIKDADNVWTLTGDRA